MAPRLSACGQHRQSESGSAATSITAATGTSHQAMTAKITIGAQAEMMSCGRYCAEEGLQLLDAVDHRQHHAARALRRRTTPGRVQLAVEQTRAQSSCTRPAVSCASTVRA